MPDLQKIARETAEKLWSKWPATGHPNAPFYYDECILTALQTALAQGVAEAVEKSGAVGVLAEVSSDYNNPRFTDRHGTGPRIDAALASLRALTSPAGVKTE